MPAHSGKSQSPTREFSRRLVKIMAIMERFYEEAQTKGHRPFAEALYRCTKTIASGDMACPLGKLVVDESARTGKFMAFDVAAHALSQRGQAPAGAQGPIPVADIMPVQALEWQSKYTKLWSLLKEDAKLAGDADCLEALEACNDLTQTHRCPVRELIVQSLWHLDKS
jgi:hypothetical protein